MQVFLIFCEILLLDKFEGADVKYDKIVFNFQSKNTQIKLFWSQIQSFLFFREILQIGKFEGADFKYDNSLFKNSCRKYRNKAFLVKSTQIKLFWSQIQAFLFLYKVLQSHKFEGADFKYQDCFLKFQPQNTLTKHFWSEIQAFSLFHNILQLDKFNGAYFKYDSSFFKILARKYPNKAFLLLLKIKQLGRFKGADFNRF